MSTTYGHPGVYVREQLLSGQPSFDPSVSTAVFIAPHGKGPQTPYEVRSWSEFTRVFGGFPARTSLLPYALYNYFSSGGSRAVVVRVASASAVTATVDLNDRATSPEPTIGVSALNPGVWGNDIDIAIADAGTEQFSLWVHYQGTSTANVVERWNDLSMDPDSPRYFANIINSAASGSKYIVVENLESETSGYVESRPATTTAGSPISLTTGADGDTPTTLELTTALDVLDSVDHTFVLNLPGVSETSVIDAAVAKCATSGRGFVVIDTSPGMTVSEAAAYAESLAASSYGAVYYPWLNFRDPAGTGAGSTRSLPPGGSVVGAYVNTDSSRGVWKAPAGLSTRVPGAVSLTTTLSDSDLDTLHASHVNAVRHIAQTGICVMGARTLKQSEADKYVPVRRTLIYLRQELLNRTRWASFEPNDAVLWRTLEGRIEQFLTEFWQEGGLKGNSASDAFFVRVDDTINTPEVVSAGEVRIEVGVALQYPAEFVIITLSQWEGGNGQAVELTAVG